MTGDRLPAAVLARVEVVLCDADGTLFPAAEPASAASADVTNRLLAALGSTRRCTAEELRPAATGPGFRATARELAARHGVVLLDLERWVAEERAAVTAHLVGTLRPDPEVRAALIELSTRYPLAAVGSGPPSRVDGCFAATWLDGLIGPAVRFGAEDAPPSPGRPAPSVHRYACDRLGIPPAAALAVANAVAGVRSAVGAGCVAVGTLAFVPAAERPDRAAALRAAGAAAVVPSWAGLVDLLTAPVTAMGVAR